MYHSAWIKMKSMKIFIYTFSFGLYPGAVSDQIPRYSCLSTVCGSLGFWSVLFQRAEVQLTTVIISLKLFGMCVCVFNFCVLSNSKTTHKRRPPLKSRDLCPVTKSVWNHEHKTLQSVSRKFPDSLDKP